MKRLISAILVFSMMFGLFSTISVSVFADGAAANTNENAPISELIDKVADGLDANDQTNVTLTVPGVTDNLGIDIVYIMGGSLSEETAKTSVKIQKLKETIAAAVASGTPVNFGIVTYSYVLDAVMELTTFKTVEDLENFEKIIGESFAKVGTEHNFNDGMGNLEQALINAKKMLSGPKALKNHPERQHIVLYSSGQTYEFNSGENNDIPGCAPAYVTNADNVAGKTSMYWTGSQWCYLRNAGSSRYYIPTAIVDTYKANKDKYASDWDCYWSYITKWVEADRKEESAENPHFYEYKGEVDPDGYATYSFSDLTAELKQKYPNIAYKTTLGKNDLATAHAIIYERAMYEAYEYAKPNIIDAGINLHPIYVPIAGNANYINGAYSRNYVGHCFMDMLAGGKGKAAIYYKNSDEALFFASVQAQILYTTAAGSYVEDYIGYEEGKGNFEFIKNPEYIKLVVGGVAYRTDVVATKEGADLSLAFTAPNAEKATFELDYYYGNGKTTEMFIWTINEAVSLGKPASLTYRLQLTEKQDAIGTYIVPTNNLATFQPVDSDNQKGELQFFRVPKVTYTVEPITVSGVKVWEDNDNQDGVRPDSITIRLFADGVEIASVQTNEEKKWAWSFDGLRAVVNGRAIVYTVTEDSVDGYTTVITGTAANGFTITNAHEIEKTGIEVRKAWTDNNNQDGIRPESITVKLFADGKDTGRTIVLSADNDWRDSFTDLDVNARGAKITYTVKEVTVDGYTEIITGNAANGFIITNIHEVAKTEVNVNKVWNDNDNQDGIRPSRVTVKLFADGQDTGKTLVLSAANNWSGSFTELDVNVNGTAIVYTVQEVAVDGYTTEITGSAANGFTVTNTHEVEKTGIKIEKFWNDQNDQDGIRPDSITIKLFADDQDTGKTLVLSAANNWTGSFTELDVNANGAKIVYTVKEIGVDGYTTVISGNAADGYVVTNTHEVDKTEVKVNKVWDDNNDQDGIRPDSITIKLFADGKDTGKTIVLNAANGWTGSFTELDANANGTKIVYTVQEVAVDGYTAEITGSAANGFTVTNTHEVDKTEVKVNKVWDDNNDQDGIRPDSVTIKLFADGQDTGKTLVLNAANGWTGSFTELDVNANGTAIAYTVEEVAVEGYTLMITGNAANGFTITNIHRVDKTEVKVNKVWDDNNDQDGIRPDSITIKLFADGKDTGKTIVLNAANGWTGSFTELDVNANGTKIVYTVQEVAVDGYTAEITGSAANGFTVTNTHEVDKTEVKVNKVWDDNNDQDGIRPDSVTIKLFADGKDTGKTLVLNAANGWTGSFTELDVNANGTAIAYTVEEVAVEGYTLMITGNAANGFTITNIHRVDKTGIEVNKVWRDNEDQDGIRPDSVTIKLFADGQDTGKTIVLSAANNWKGSFTELDVNANGTKIVYTIQEVAVDGYTATIIGTAEIGFTVINAHEVDKTEVKVNKVWNDNNDQDGIRTESVTIKLFADGKDTGKTLVLSEANGWTGSFTELDVNANGTAIVYTVQEVAVDGYTAEITGSAANGFTVTNTHEVDKTEVEVNKVWRDNEDQDGIRTESVTIKLFADGQDTGKTIVLSAANNWKGSFTELDVNANGTKIVYTVQEVAVDGYTATIIGTAEIGFTVINAHEVDKTEVKVNKVWNDNNDQDGIRTESVTIKLFADGKDTGKTLVLSAANNWTGSFTDLDVNANGTAIVYTVKEVAVDGYTAEITGSAANGFTVTNTHEVDKTEVKVNKVWEDNNNQDGIRPDSITIKLFANGQDTGKTIVLSIANNWTGSFTDLDVNANGTAIVYTVKEVAVDGYTAEITGSAANGFTVTNTHEVDKTEVKVNKVWNDNGNQDGIRPNSVTIKLFANGQDTGKTLVLSAANNWNGSFTELDVNANGTKVVYTVEEVAVDGYTATVIGSAENGFTVANTHEVEKTEIEVNKVWEDNNNQDGIRPGSVTIKLFANGQDTGKTVVLSVLNNWNASFTDLDVNAMGTAIVYTVEEVAVDGYTAEITGSAANGFTVTNTHEVDKTEVEVNKVWKDNNDQDGIRPNSVTIKLFADGQDTGKTLVLSAANNWTGSFTDLDMNANGAEIVYTVKEVAVEGYTTSYEGFTIINTHIASTNITIDGIKYLDEEVAEGFTFVLVDENGNTIGTVNSAADGKFTFGTISYKEAGTYKYLVTEVAGDDEEIFYDDSVYTVTVTVTVDGEKLVASYTLLKNDAAHEGEIAFYNETLTEIEEEDPPLDVPDTGDNIGIYMMLSALSFAILTVSVFGKPRRKTN